ncbi:helix-turn-helix domain-containing protein [Variovorax fucosicus]|uniref:helix-turn-helix domain-containing protein n=1 Tax=Variovorax fucosicus TaxID=3053517 RepID=UPI0025771B92|nr:helix-turn-helix domain-containing protein [Variovorax sp. J22G47]MDM0057340.1 hypothetical protein [Variovorax sp. J22G47]
MAESGQGGATPEFLTHREAAALLRMTENALSIQYCKRMPHLPPRAKFGRKLLYKREDVLACIKPIPS